MRCFIAIELPEGLRIQVGRIVDDLRKTGADVKWVSEKGLHLTLKFLGATDESRVDEIAASVGRKISHYPPFYIKLTGIGSFPSGRRPRVLWLGIEESPVLMSLQRAVEEAVTGIGFPSEERPFSPHLTLGRVRSERRGRDLIQRLGSYSEVRLEAFLADHIKLMKSELKPAGAEYTCLAEIPFAGRDDVQ